MKKPNITNPLRARYVGPTRGLFSFVNHDCIAAISWDIQERCRYVLAFKPKKELPTRSRCLMHIDIDECHPDVAAAVRLGLESPYPTKSDADRVERAVRKHRRMMLNYIRKLIPDCPWNGLTIFP